MGIFPTFIEWNRYDVIRVLLQRCTTLLWLDSHTVDALRYNYDPRTAKLILDRTTSYGPMGLAHLDNYPSLSVATRARAEGTIAVVKRMSRVEPLTFDSDQAEFTLWMEDTLLS